MIDRATQQRIKDVADIVDVVSDYVHLERRGRNYMGLCPFHNERTPSFSVNPARNFCFCFSCKKGGSPVNFLMEKEGYSYTEALRELAKKYGIKIEEKELTDQERSAMERREAMHLANEWAMQIFEHNLRETDEGRDIGLQYFYGRGITDEAIRAFHLGYSMSKGNPLLAEAKRKGFNIDLLKDLGLVGVSQSGEDYDKYRGRVIFPILNSTNKVIGFGARTLQKDKNPKYVNPPESDVYRKSFELYGMSQARSAINRENLCYLVEGYFDVIGFWQAGIKNVVASCGTALTADQVRLIRRFTNNVTIVYDGDSAGIKAALKAMDMFLENDLEVSLLLLPDGEDPDSFSRKHTPEEVMEYVKQNTTDVIRFKAQILMKDVTDNPQRKFAALQSMISTLSCITDKMKREIYIQECSRIMDFKESVIRESVAKAIYAKKLEAGKRYEHKRLTRDLESGRIEPQNYSPNLNGGNPLSANDALSSNQGLLNGVSPNSGYSLPSAIANPNKIQTTPSPDRSRRGVNNLQTPEWNVIKYCIRYGFLDFCEALTSENLEDEDADEPKPYLTVVEYVKEELDNDRLEFSVVEYSEVFSLLLEMLPEFRSELSEFRKSLETDLQEKLRKGYDAIGMRQLSLSEIKREEIKLKEEVDNYAHEEITRFSREYPSRLLASHEVDTVRTITTEAILEPYQLSNIYSRERPVENEEDKLYQLLPMAVTVWKNGILDKNIADLVKQLQEISGKGNPDEERKLQGRLTEMMRLRSEVAKNIGDRIICPNYIRH